MNSTQLGGFSKLGFKINLKTFTYSFSIYQLGVSYTELPFLFTKYVHFFDKMQDV